MEHKELALNISKWFIENGVSAADGTITMLMLIAMIIGEGADTEDELQDGIDLAIEAIRIEATKGFHRQRERSH